MIDEFVKLDVLLQLESISCERQAMIAFNAERENRGEVIAYDETAFLRLVDRIEKIRERIRQ